MDSERQAMPATAHLVMPGFSVPEMENSICVLSAPHLGLVALMQRTVRVQGTALRRVTASASAYVMLGLLLKAEVYARLALVANLKHPEVLTNALFVVKEHIRTLLVPNSAVSVQHFQIALLAVTTSEIVLAM